MSLFFVMFPRLLSLSSLNELERKLIKDQNDESRYTSEAGTEDLAVKPLLFLLSTL